MVATSDNRIRSVAAAAGYGAVKVVCGDGAAGVPDYAPYDRIIVTTGAWDLPPEWWAQLCPGGRIVLPLSIRGIQLSVGLDSAGDHLVSRSADTKPTPVRRSSGLPT